MTVPDHDQEADPAGKHDARTTSDGDVGQVCVAGDGHFSSPRWRRYRPSRSRGLRKQPTSAVEAADWCRAVCASGRFGHGGPISVDGLYLNNPRQCLIMERRRPRTHRRLCVGMQRGELALWYSHSRRPAGAGAHMVPARSEGPPRTQVAAGPRPVAELRLAGADNTRPGDMERRRCQRDGVRSREAAGRDRHWDSRDCQSAIAPGEKTNKGANRVSRAPSSTGRRACHSVRHRRNLHGTGGQRPGRLKTGGRGKENY